MGKDDTLEPFDDIFEPFGLEGAPAGDAPREVPIRRPTTVPARGPDALVCASCGSPNDAANRHCERCGARLVRSQMPVAPQPMLRTTAGARALIVLSAVVLAVALMALVVNLFSGNGTAEPTETTLASSSSIVPVAITELQPIRVSCTAELEAFPCTALIDGDPSTSWNGPDGGIGAEITFFFSPPVQITEMVIQNVQDECRFLRNHRMKGVEVLVNDLTQAAVKTLDDSRSEQRIEIRSLSTSSLTLRITSGYIGQTCDGKEPFAEMAAEDVFFWGRPTPEG